MVETILDNHELEILRESGSRFMGKMTILETADDSTVIITCDGKKWLATESDAFEALFVLRKEMKKDGVIPVCNGAAINVFPSQMARDGGGTKAYKMVMGETTKMSDLVYIYEYEDGLELSYPEEQEVWVNEWFKRLS